MRCSFFDWSIGVVHDSDVRFAPLLVDIENRICIYSYNKYQFVQDL